MDRHSQGTLRRVEENDDKLTKLWICDTSMGGMFSSTDGDDYSKLGAAIGKNTHLTSLMVELIYAVALDVTNNEFYEGCKLNSSIHKLTLHCESDIIAGGVVQKILEAYQENNNLTILHITDADLQNGREHVIAQTLGRCTHLNSLTLQLCNITDEQLLPMVDAIRLERLDLSGNRIGNAGCETIATLLRDPNSNINHIDLSGNSINNEGVTILTNNLANNTKLRELWLRGNAIDESSVDNFARLLCNTSSINSIYSSNHTLEELVLMVLNPYTTSRQDELRSLLKMNKCTNKSHVAIKKILKYHPNIDMEPFFEWNMEGEGEGERDLKALPYVIDWFERAEEAVTSDEGGGSYNISERKLSAIYQFAKAMPLLFVPVPKQKKDD